MFKELFSWWQQDILLKDAFNETKLTLDKALAMFSYSMRVALNEIEDDKKIYEMDREINEMQINVRKKVLEHLSVKPAQDITSSLILVTIVVDIERIGDYSKNITELGCIKPDNLKESKHLTEIKNIGKKLEKLFGDTADAFIEADYDKAKQTTNEYTEINHKCDEDIQKIANTEGLTGKEYVFFAVFLRHLKRVSSHLRNISTSITNPFHKLGYKPEGE